MTKEFHIYNGLIVSILKISYIVFLNLMKRYNMKKSAMFLILCFLINSNLIAGILPEYLRADFNGEYRPLTETSYKKDVNKLMGNQDPIIRNYDVQHYSLVLNWYDVMNATQDTAQFRYWSGKINIQANITTDNVNSIDLDAGLLRIFSVIVDGAAISPTPTCSSENILSIALPKTYNKDEIADITIVYRYENPDNIGFNLFNKHTFVEKNDNFNNGDSLFTLERIAYTQGEPKDTRYWFPCNDQTAR